MRSRYVPEFPRLLALVTVLGARPVLAADRPCSPITVDADSGIRSRWPELPGRVRQAFDRREDIDACASVTLTETDDGISVGVRLPDGRTAARSVERADDVLPLVEALLLVPEHREEPTANQPTTSEQEPPVPGSSRARDPGARPRRSPETPDDRVRVELSLGAGARAGAAQTSAGVVAFSFLDIRGWLAGFEGRLDRYQVNVGGPESAALELAALGGRRFRSGSLSFDLFAGPAVVHQGTETNVTQLSPGGPVVTESTSNTVVRMLGAARLNFGARSTLGTFVGIDGEIGPERVPGADSQLPPWTLGLIAGATVGTP